MGSSNPRLGPAAPDCKPGASWYLGVRTEKAFLSIDGHTIAKTSNNPGWPIILDRPVIPAIFKKSFTSSHVTEPLESVLKVMVLVIIWLLSKFRRRWVVGWWMFRCG